MAVLPNPVQPTTPSTLERWIYLFMKYSLEEAFFSCVCDPAVQDRYKVEVSGGALEQF